MEWSIKSELRIRISFAVTMKSYTIIQPVQYITLLLGGKFTTYHLSNRITSLPRCFVMSETFTTPVLKALSHFCTMIMLYY